MLRRAFLSVFAGGLAVCAAPKSGVASVRTRPGEILLGWYGLVLELVRHTATYSPPVASRAFAYLGITAFEALASGSSNLVSLAGQLRDLPRLPKRASGKKHDDAIVLQAALATSVKNFFANTGPTGQRAMAAMERKLRAAAIEGVGESTVRYSEAFGQEIAAHIHAWSLGDGGANIVNLGFPLIHDLAQGNAHWVPTSTIPLQQKPLLPNWGKNRPFALPAPASCNLPPPPVYSEDKSSTFYREALEVFETKKNLTPEQRAIARFWSDDPMLSPTPPGHWISIALQIVERDSLDVEKSADVLARLGIVLADSFIACWHAKFEYDLLRPVTFIRRTMDAKWESVMNTPPFPEYPSGHSTQSGAAADVLTAAFGDDFAFDDATHARDKIKPRHFTSFRAAAAEAGISRLYGGIHFRAAIERGLEQGRCVAVFANALKTRKSL